MRYFIDYIFIGGGVMKIGNSRPVNKQAAIVASKQPKDSSFEIKRSEKKLNFLFWKEPRLMVEFSGLIDLTGTKFGRLKVIGYLGRGKWQCRCLCGNYNSRRTKAVTNKSNDVDACEECRELAYIKRKYDFHKTGKDKDIIDYY